MTEWTPIEDLPEPGERLGQYWVIVDGEEYHSGSAWSRRAAGLARTDNGGFHAADISLIAARDHMALSSAEVTYFMPIILPPFPSTT